MKKNLYDIMNEAEEKNIETLANGIEYQTPSDISEERIEAKVMAKTGLIKPKKKLSRTLFVKCGAAAACLAIIIYAYPIAKGIASSQNDIATEKNAEVTTNYALHQPEIGCATSNTYVFFYPDGNGNCVPHFYTETLNNGESSETMKTLIARFFSLCGIEGVTVVDSKVTDTSTTEYHTFQGMDLVGHTVGTKTLTLTLEGTATLDDFTLKCLVNTLDSISYADYFKIIYNGNFVAIDGKTPEQGFTKFDIEVEYDHGEPPKTEASTTAALSRTPSEETATEVLTETGKITLPYIPE